MADNHSVWLVTGCSSGFGRELAHALLERGRRVVVTSRNLAALDAFKAQPNALVLALDVTNRAQIAAVVEQAERHFGAIDVLVNNAGYGYLAALEEGEDAEIRALFETNVFGLAAVTRAVLPGMRRRGRGHVVNISSLAGLNGFPGLGYYCATKFAVEGLSEALAKEVASLGIKVTLVEPGPFRTAWADAALKTTRHEIDAYAETAGARRAATKSYNGAQPGDPVRAAAAIVAAVESPEPPLHLLLGGYAYQAAAAKLQSLTAEIETWKALTLGADFPKTD